MGQSIIELYKKFDKYKYVDEESIYYKILPSLRLNQYKSDNKTFFYNWAYLNDKAQKEYIETGNIQPFNWRSGNNLWLYDIVILRKSKEVMSWVYNYFKKLLKTNESISWLRLDKNDKVYRVAKKYKREFHN